MIAERLTHALEGRAFRKALRRLADLLEQEGALLHRTDLAAASALAPKMEAALQDLPPVPEGEREAAQAALADIRALADRNRRILAAALEGAQQAREDLARMREAGLRLGYDRTGGAVAARGPAGSGRRA